MKLLLTNATVFQDGAFSHVDVAVENDRIVDVLNHREHYYFGEIFDLSGKYLFPGFTDVHVHLREPGFFYKETVAAATRAGAASGYTSLLAMPNLDPVPDCPENLEKELEIIKRDAVIGVYPYASITIGEKGKELVDFAALYGKAIAFSDDGKGVQDGEIMKQAMQKTAALGAVLAAHCEDYSLLSGGCIHDGEYARKHGYVGISSASEYAEVKRDVELARLTGAKFHVCHVSTAESVAIIRRAKLEGIDVTAETAPHYLTLCDEDIRDEGRFKMNPPLRSSADRAALAEALKDGTIDIVATDHAPHSAEEKARGLKDSLFGITGLETAFPILYTKLVKSGKLPLARLVQAMSVAPAARFGIESGIKKGGIADLTAFDLDDDYVVDSNKFISKGKSTPFDGERVFGRCVLTISKGRLVWNTIKK